MTSFIEQQFPVSKLSKESYKERKAAQSQTLTGLGKWWGRKPLVLVRAAILGCLMPASDNPRRDMEIFLKIMSMDDTGLSLRRQKSFSAQELYDLAAKDHRLSRHVPRWFDLSGDKPKLQPGVEKKEVEAAVFSRLGYDEKLTKCMRPEQLPDLAPQTWNEINHHLGTSAKNLQELVRQLSVKRFGRNAVVGDCFCGGGSIPFEAARMGCDTYASDLNPIAGLLTWASIHLCGADEKKIDEIKEFQRKVYDKIDGEITALGIEHNESGDRALSYLYCLETTCPECGTIVPMLPSLVVGIRAGKVIAKLVKKDNNYDIAILSDVSDRELKEASAKGTVTSRGLVCPDCGKTTPISVLRHDRTDENGSTVYGLRKWEMSEFEPRDDDVFRERLYAIRYERPDGSRYYRAPNERDLLNENKVRQIVSDNIIHWQEIGLIPTMEIVSGDETDRLLRERGFTYWHHLYSVRQLFVLSLFAKEINDASSQLMKVAGMLGLNKCIDWNSKLCRWDSSRDQGKQTYYNQALNTLWNWGTGSLLAITPSWFFNINNYPLNIESSIAIADARDARQECDLWITDPPYADAVNYHELSEFFLAWDKALLPKAFPDWYTDSKRILAIKGDEHFSRNMIEIYSNLAAHMPDDGMQIVMFTHSDPAVWAQLALIMWKAGLKVTAAWNIATETDASGLKDGNYVKGTVLLVLRKQLGGDTAFLDEISADIKAEVVRQIDSMRTLDDREEPNFSDPDYVLAAYAASLKVLTSYKEIGEIDLDYELNLAIHDPGSSQMVKLIERAKKIAYDCIIPLGFDSYIWKELSSAERFYIKGLESEKNGNYQSSTYQEYARGYAVTSYKRLMASIRANSARLKTPAEFAMRTINDVPGFEASLLRALLAAIYIAVKEDENPEKGLWHIRNNLPDYWGSRDLVRQLLAFLRDTRDIENMPHWKQAAEMADHIYVLVDNDHI